MDENSPNKDRVLLAVLAHPDDESFGMGGTLALYAERGVKVHLICATRGEVGTMDAEYMQGFNSIAERRETELRCAAGHLKLAGVHFLDYRDSGMPGTPDNQHPQALVAAPLDEVAGKVAHYIRRLRPNIVLTFDPIGGYKHPDHITVHKATVAAFDLSADPDFADPLPPYRASKLYFHIFPKGMVRFAVALMRLFGRDPRRFGRNKDIDLASLAEEGNFPIHARIDYRRVSARRDAAAACHASQGGKQMSRGPLGFLRRILGSKDLFMRAYPEFQSQQIETDLFGGLS